MLNQNVVKKKGNGFWREVMKHKGLISLAIPGLMFVIVFYYLPMFGLVLAFKDFNITKGIWGSDWVGFTNFKFFFHFRCRLCSHTKYDFVEF